MGVRYKLSVIMVMLAIIAPLGVNKVVAAPIAVIEMYYENMTFTYTDEYITPSNHLIAEEIFERKINSPIEEKMKLVSRKISGGADYKTALLYCFPLLSQTIEKVSEKLNTPPTDSEIRFDPFSHPMFTISRETAGVKVLEDRLYMDIYFALKASSSPRIKIPVERPQASVKLEDNIKLTRLRARYSTDFSTSSPDRKHNVRLALSKINGKRIDAGETISFNELVGRRTAKNGFKEAKIIKGGKYVPGYGGGVCQASTTLYNAALLSDLEVVSVHRHSLQSSYELPSFDAMVNSGSSDLKLRNGGQFPVFIRTYTDENRAYVEIYGSSLPYKIKRKSEITFKGETPGSDEFIDENNEYFDEFAEPGSKKVVTYSHPEVHSNGYLLFFDFNGALIEKRLIRTDVYGSVRGTIAVAP